MLSVDCYCGADDSKKLMLPADVKLVVQGGKELPAHSHILAVNSRVLLNLILGPGHTSEPCKPPCPGGGLRCLAPS